MLFLHGGNFQSGGAGGKLYDGRFIANMSEVVVVVINYRLGKVIMCISQIVKSELAKYFGQFIWQAFTTSIHNNILL